MFIHKEQSLNRAYTLLYDKLYLNSLYELGEVFLLDNISDMLQFSKNRQ